MEKIIKLIHNSENVILRNSAFLDKKSYAKIDFTESCLVNLFADIGKEIAKNKKSKSDFYFKFSIDFFDLKREYKETHRPVTLVEVTAHELYRLEEREDLGKAFDGFPLEKIPKEYLEMENNKWLRK